MLWLMGLIHISSLALSGWEPEQPSPEYFLFPIQVLLTFLSITNEIRKRTESSELSPKSIPGYRIRMEREYVI